MQYAFACVVLPLDMYSTYCANIFTDDKFHVSVKFIPQATIAVAIFPDFALNFSMFFILF